MTFNNNNNNKKKPLNVAQKVKNLPAIQETQEDALEEEMTTHSSVLAWRIPWTGESGKLPSMWSPRVGHDWATNMLDDIPNTLTSILWPLFPVTFSFALLQYPIAIQNHSRNSPEPHHIWNEVWPFPPFPLSLLQRSLATWTPSLSLSSPSSLPFSPHSGWMAGTLSDSLSFLSFPPPFQQQASPLPLFRGWIL